MLFVISLVIVAAFVYFCGEVLKKYPYIFYIGAAVLSVAASAAYSMCAGSTIPVFVKQNIIGIITKGSLGTAMFVAVMYAGALPDRTDIKKRLMRIRGELSITAAVMVLCHNITYGKTYFRLLFTDSTAMPLTQRIAAVISLLLIVLLIVLTATSFPSVRKKMNPHSWKKLQRSAYVFYALTYVHIMLISVPYARSGLIASRINVIVYSIVFMVYAAMRLTKCIYRHRSSEADAYRMAAAVRTVCALMGIAVCVTAFTGKAVDSDSDGMLSEAGGMHGYINGYDKADSAAQGGATQNGATQNGTATYTGTAVCDIYGYTVTVVMTMEDGKITGVTATSDADSQNAVYFDMADTPVIQGIIEKQGTKGVDAVSGATLSSKAIKTAFYNAYKSATR